MSGRPVASRHDGYSRLLKTTNLSSLPQGMDHRGVRDFRPGTDNVIKPPPTLVHNHLHGSDMFIRNQLEAVSPPKFHRSTTPSPSYTDSDYFSASSRGTPPPLAHMSPDLIRHHDKTHEVTHPPTSTPQYTDNHHTRSSSYQFSLPRPVNSVGSRSRARRRHSSIEFSVHKDTPSRSDNGHCNSIPSRPQSSASNVQDHKAMSDRLNRHQSYYEAVNNEAVTSQTIFTHSTEIRPLIEETNGLTDLEQQSVLPRDEVCTNGIDLEMMGSQEEHRPDVFMYHQQANGELNTATNNFPQQKTNGQQQQSSPHEGAHPRLLNSTGSPLPLQSISPKPYQRSIPVKHSPPHYQRSDKPRHFSSGSYDTDHVTQRPPRAFTRSHTLSSSSPYADKRLKHKPPPISVPELNRDECFSDGELGLRQGTLPVGSERKKDRKRNKSFTSVSSPSPSSKKTSSRPRSISSHVLQRIAKNFSRRGDLDHPKVLHVFDDKDSYDLPAYLGSEDSIPTGGGEMSELLVDRMSINDTLTTQDYHRTQSMEMLSSRSAKPAGKEAHSMDDLLNERPSTPKSMAKGWGSRRKKSVSMDTDVFTDVTSKSGNRKTSADYREAIFKAVMNNNSSQVDQLLTTGQIDLAWHNSDDLTVLDMAVMLNHTRVAHLLMAYGAKESSKFVRDPDSRRKCLFQLVTTAEEHVNKYQTNLSLSSINTSTQALEEMSRQKELWSTKKTMLQHMISVYDSATPPDPPANVSLDITSSISLTVRFFEPKRDNGAPVTRYRVEWSEDFNFTATKGSFVLSDLSYKLSSPNHARYLEYTIPDLESGTKYFVRVSASNMKRFGPATYSTPAEAVPSSWHDIDKSQARYSGSTGKIQGVAMQLKQVITESSVGKDTTGTTGRGKMKRGLSKIFGGALKFHKNLKAGLYLACLMYTDDVKVLVTVDDYLPIVEVAESFNTQTIKQDFLWLSKLACTWENVRTMRDNSENYTASSSIQFRNRLLHIITDLQASLGVQDLGLIHPLPYQNNDSLVIVLVRNVKDGREIQNSSLHWAQWGKLWKKHAAATAADQTPSTIPDQLITEAQFMMDHNLASVKPVERGLYLGYLKTRSSLAGVKVVVSKQFPNLLPHTKIRDNPHISKDEWAWLTYLHQSKETPPPNVAIEACCELQKLLTFKVTELLTSKGITSKEDIEQHRIYVKDVVELNEDVSFLLLLPPPDQVCTSFGDTDRFEQVSYMGMPFTSFEIAQLYTYQQVFITFYTQVSSTLEMELLIARHRLREAFSKDEISKGKVLQSKLEWFQQETEQVWKDMHWLDSAVQIGRKSDVIHGVLLRSLRKNPITSQPQSRSSSMSFTTLPKQELPHDQHPAKPAHFEKHISTFPEELKVTPLYDTGLTKGSTVKLHIVPSTVAIEVVQLAVGALHEAKLKRHLDKSIVPSDPNDFYLVYTLNDSYDERTLDDDYPMLELYRETTKFKLFLKKKSCTDSSDSYTTSV